jgi:olfactory receptor
MSGEAFPVWDASSDKNCLCGHSGCGEHRFHFISSDRPGTLSLILISYTYIALAVLRIKSALGRRRKAFNTCGSHLTVVSLFYGNIIYMYMQPGNNSSQDQGKFLTLFYNLVTPMLNPIIYTLRNKDVKGALKRLVSRK